MIVYIKKDSHIGDDKYYIYTNKDNMSYSDPIYLIYTNNKSIINYIKLTGISLNTLEEILK